KANEQAEDEDKLTDEEILGQVASFVLAGADSSAIALALIIQHLAERPDIQEKLRSEIVAAREGRDGDLSYEELVKLPYVDAVVKETLRLLCKDVVAPISSPVTGKDGRLRKEVVIPKGTIVFIGILASNINQPSGVRTRRSGSPSAGSRRRRVLWSTHTSRECIRHCRACESPHDACVNDPLTCTLVSGLKFAELELKAMLSVLLESFDFSTSGKDIVWNLATVRFPTVGVNGTKPELPLMVKPLKGKA
ncbi:hypothetical protein EVJ58_g10697, partial [Rhodofomes roseus]